MCSSNQDNKKIVIENKYTSECVKEVEDVITEAGIRIECNEKEITFIFDAVNLKMLEAEATNCNAKTYNNALLLSLLDKLHSIHSFASSGGKLVYASFNKDKKVDNKDKNKARRQGFNAFLHTYSSTNNVLDDKILNNIYCVDSYDFLKTLPDNSIDIVLTSPPYNFGIKYNSTEDATRWKEYFDKLFLIFGECVRVLKSGGRIIVNVQPLFSDYIPTHHFISNFFIQKGLIWKGEILWEKNNYNCKYCTWGSWKSPASPYLKYSWEYIEIYCKNTLKKEGRKEDIDISAEEFKKWVYGKWSIAPERNMKKYKHDAMFPEELVRRGLKLFSYKGDIVLDPFNGAGTTTKIAKELGRRYIGLDIDKTYCDIAKERLKEVKDTLF